MKLFISRFFYVNYKIKWANWDGVRLYKVFNYCCCHNLKNCMLWDIADMYKSYESFLLQRTKTLEIGTVVAVIVEITI